MPEQCLSKYVPPGMTDLIDLQPRVRASRITLPSSTAAISRCAQNVVQKGPFVELGGGGGMMVYTV